MSTDLPPERVEQLKASAAASVEWCATYARQLVIELACVDVDARFELLTRALANAQSSGIEIGIEMAYNALDHVMPRASAPK